MPVGDDARAVIAIAENRMTCGLADPVAGSLRSYQARQHHAFHHRNFVHDLVELRVM
jgi:hypothetical protein